MGCAAIEQGIEGSLEAVEVLVACPLDELGDADGFELRESIQLFFPRPAAAKRAASSAIGDRSASGSSVIGSQPSP